MKQDIRTAEDIDLLVRTFYQGVRPDEVIGHFFTHLDWDHHIPRITSFWRMVLLGEKAYAGDPMTTHLQLARRMPMEQAHFDRWLALWTATVDELFSGTTAEEAKQRARAIAGLMAFKVKQKADD